MSAHERDLFKAIVLGGAALVSGCGAPTTPADTGAATNDAGNDAAASNDAGSDAASSSDAGNDAAVLLADAGDAGAVDAADIDTNMPAIL